MNHSEPQSEQSLALGAPTTAPWSESLEELHQESSRTHFLDRWTRSAMIDRILPAVEPATMAQTSAVHRLHARGPPGKIPARLIGVDFISLA